MDLDNYVKRCKTTGVSKDVDRAQAWSWGKREHRNWVLEGDTYQQAKFTAAQKRAAACKNSRA